MLAQLAGELAALQVTDVCLDEALVSLGESLQPA